MSDKILKLKRFLFFISLLFSVFSFAQTKTAKIEIINADYVEADNQEYPDAKLLIGNIQVKHQGAILQCNKAYLFEKLNKIIGLGNVQIVQGDTLFLNSKYIEYDGNTQISLASGDVVLHDPQSTLSTSSLYFDRTTQQAYYNSGATIVNQENILKSNKGNYYANQKLFKFQDNVIVTNPEYTMETNYLEYNTLTGDVYIEEDTYIRSEANTIFTKKGTYNTKTNQAFLTKNSHIIYQDRTIKGDSIYFDRNKGFSSIKNNVFIKDTINKTVARADYGEFYNQKDSIFLSKNTLIAVESSPKDTLYTSAERIIITGKTGNRETRAYHDVRFLQNQMSGKADSLYSNENEGITKLIGKPVLWNAQSQITGDLMLLINNKETNKLDSLKVLNNVFIIEKDTLGTGYNQVKGQYLLGRFDDGKLAEIDIIRNTEMLYYVYTDNELYGIDKNVSSKINLTFYENKINTVTFFTEVKGDTYPEDQLPENARILRGFKWRGDEQIFNLEQVTVP